MKSTTLSFPKLCAQLFDGEVSENGQSSSEKSLSCPEPLMIEDAEYIIETQETSTSKPNYSSHAEDQRPTKKAKNSKNSNVSTIEEDMSKALNMIIGKSNGPSFKDCRDKLRDIGWGASSPLHKMALVIFCESETYREAWMQLQEDEVEDWVRMIGNKLRLEP